jgi:hypothetical protein
VPPAETVTATEAETAKGKQEAEKEDRKRKKTIAAGGSHDGAHAHAHNGARRATFLICNSCFWCATLLLKNLAGVISRRCPRCRDGKVRPMSIGSGTVYGSGQNGSMRKKGTATTVALTSAA